MTEAPHSHKKPRARPLSSADVRRNPPEHLLAMSHAQVRSYRHTTTQTRASVLLHHLGMCADASIQDRISELLPGLAVTLCNVDLCHLRHPHSRITE